MASVWSPPRVLDAGSPGGCVPIPAAYHGGSGVWGSPVQCRPIPCGWRCGMVAAARPGKKRSWQVLKSEYPISLILCLRVQKRLSGC
jgi:hypothetical protein